MIPAGQGMKTHCEGLKTYEDLIARAFKLENTLFEKTSQLKELGLKLRQANTKAKDLLDRREQEAGKRQFIF